MDKTKGMYATQPGENLPTEVLDHFIWEGKHSTTTNIRSGLAHVLVNRMCM
jgi:hypothetical protein